MRCFFMAFSPSSPFSPSSSWNTTLFLYKLLFHSSAGDKGFVDMVRKDASSPFGSVMHFSAERWQREQSSVNTNNVNKISLAIFLPAWMMLHTKAPCLPWILLHSNNRGRMLAPIWESTVDVASIFNPLSPHQDIIINIPDDFLQRDPTPEFPLSAAFSLRRRKRRPLKAAQTDF